LNESNPSTRLHLGAAWYPEHWPEERWADDIRLMREAGLTVARMAEFAWSTLEPSEGDFRLDWLERAVSALSAAGIVSVLGTPTAAPPAWLVQAHPDLLAVDEGGRRVQFGNRCHYCVNSPEFHAASVRIVQAMGERFGGSTDVIGWQLDNEYNRVCYCDRCRKLFQGVPGREVRLTGRSERTLDDALLEPDVLGVGSDPDSYWLPQPRTDAGVQALRHRELP